MSEFVRDLRYAGRLYRKGAGFAVTTTLLLALGIAANTILFSIMDAVFLRRLPVDRPEELVGIVYQIPGAPPFTEQEYPFYRVLREQRDLFAGVAGHHEMNIAMRDGATSDRIRADFVTGNFFSLLGVRPLYGRILSVQDELATGALPVVLSHPFWTRRFKGDP